MGVKIGWIAAAFAGLLLLAGCASSLEDRAFFQKGWVHPEEAAEKRMNSSDW